MPIGIVVALLLSGISWIRQDKSSNLITKVAEGQQHCHDCLGTVVIESVKQTTLLEEISHNTRR